MINKEKILKVDIYDPSGRRLITTQSISFPRDFFKIKGQELVMIKAKDIPSLSKEQPIIAIFEYLNGNRVKYETTIDICTDFQMNFHVGTGEVLEERRSSFKVKAEFDGSCKFYERTSESEAPIIFEIPLPVHFYNINLGGVLFYADFEFAVGDRVNLIFLNKSVDIIAEVLRIQHDENGNFLGYGCKFIDISHSQEEIIAKFIFDWQVAEREKINKRR